MPTISLGPFLTATGKTGIVVDGFVDTGCCIEFSGDDYGLSLPLFRQVQQWRPRTATFDDYYIGGEHLSFNVQSDPYNCVDTEYGKFIRLGCVLSSLYRFNDVRRPLLKVLEEFAGCLPVKADRLHRRTVGGSTMLAEGLQQAGFEVIGASSYGRSLHVQIGWVLASSSLKKSLCAKTGWDSKAETTVSLVFSSVTELKRRVQIAKEDFFNELLEIVLLLT